MVLKVENSGVETGLFERRLAEIMDPLYAQVREGVVPFQVGLPLYQLLDALLPELELRLDKLFVDIAPESYENDVVLEALVVIKTGLERIGVMERVREFALKEGVGPESFLEDEDFVFGEERVLRFLFDRSGLNVVELVCSAFAELMQRDRDGVLNVQERIVFEALKDFAPMMMDKSLVG